MLISQYLANGGTGPARDGYSTYTPKSQELVTHPDGRRGCPCRVSLSRYSFRYSTNYVYTSPPSKRASSSPSASLSGLESPRPESPTETLKGGTPKASVVELPIETTPPTSGTTTPTAATGVSRFFGGFLRVRYPSTLLSRNIDEATEIEVPSIDSDVNSEVHDANGEGRNGEVQAGDPAAEPEATAQATNHSSNAKVADRVEEPTEEPDAADSQTVRVKGLLASVWKVQ